jgi:hypothetical protein
MDVRTWFMVLKRSNIEPCDLGTTCSCCFRIANDFQRAKASARHLRDVAIVVASTLERLVCVVDVIDLLVYLP